ncbi:excisionase family DNA binding protein [Xanthobacter sp. SG618]|uniref:helix-turn-helix domain-containing protein n=1 Tax=Xanthobacter sp. SG618 TaxID=2587121 RepID=UPI00145CC2B2|nr:helix-turn-helix domain-containing protein [Xanthobacter sp. SG618]NMN58000.1 excisionase family DNA binding protein [Xanthobacter sp. SG618]
MAKVKDNPPANGAPEDADGLLTVEEVRAYFKCSTPTVYKYLSERQLEGIKFGRSTRITKESVRKLLAKLPRFGAERAA